MMYEISKRAIYLEDEGQIRLGKTVGTCNKSS